MALAEKVISSYLASRIEFLREAFHSIGNRKNMDRRYLEGEKLRELSRQVPVGDGEFIETGIEFKRDWEYAEMLRKEIQSYLEKQLRSYRELGGRPLSSSSRWMGDNSFIELLGKSYESSGRVEFHVPSLHEGKCSKTILSKLTEDLEGLDAYRLNKALASMI